LELISQNFALIDRNRSPPYDFIFHLGGFGAPGFSGHSELCVHQNENNNPKNKTHLLLPHGYD
jgi:hypothetical protein